MACWRDFLLNQRGASTVEFVVVAPAFLFLFFMVIEVAAAFFWWKTAEKATQLGARMAIVRDAAASDMPPRNPRRAGGVFGLPCSHPSNPCDFDAAQSWTCSGGGSGCNDAAFQAILLEMRRIFGNAIQPENLIIRYDYIGLGYAGGAVVPLVTVTLSGVPFGVFLGFLSAAAGLDGGLATLPDISATLTGEDLRTAGA